MPGRANQAAARTMTSRSNQRRRFMETEAYHFR
jgi:hypothetical protein